MNCKVLLNQIKLIKNLLYVERIQFYQKEIVIYISSSYLLRTLSFLKNHVLFQYNMLVQITAVDYLKKKTRFEIVYELLSIRYNSRIKLKVCLNEFQSIESCESLFLSANWFEHSNLKRILTDYGFEGYPLRKDFPLSGYIEVKYDEKNKRIVNEFLELAQEYRSFDFISPWNTLKN